MIHSEPPHRQTCYRCQRPSQFCYCPLIQKIESPITFVILIHHLEARRKIATGRMAHLCLNHSVLIRGHDFTHDTQVNQILKNPHHHCLLLYPGPNALNLSEASSAQRNETLFSTSKRTVIFVVDGTWSTARKTVRLSENLQKLSTLCFTPQTPSQFRIRKQPAPECYSTIESIHHILELLAGPRNLASESRPHDLLLTLFNRMVEQQIGYLAQQQL